MDLGNIFALAAASAGTIGLLLSTFYTVPQQHTGLVTRFGKHVRTDTEPGLKMKIPLIEGVKKISGQEFQTKEMLETKTADDLFVKLPISIHFNISDPAVYHFNKKDAVGLMSNVVSAAVREYTSQKKFQELYNERQEIKDGVLAKVAEKVNGFGLHINDIVIDEPQASQEVKHTFDRVRSSALEKEAAKNEADAEFIRTVRRAEADKERNILIGEGVAGFRQKIADGYAGLRTKLIAENVSPEAADRFMEEAMRLDTLRDIGEKGHMVIVTPDAGTGHRVAELQALTATTTPRPDKEQDNHKSKPVPAAAPAAAPA